MVILANTNYIMGVQDVECIKTSFQCPQVSNRSVFYMCFAKFYYVCNICPNQRWDSRTRNVTLASVIFCF